MKHKAMTMLASVSEYSLLSVSHSGSDDDDDDWWMKFNTVATEMKKNKSETFTDLNRVSIKREAESRVG